MLFERGTSTQYRTEEYTEYDTAYTPSTTPPVNYIEACDDEWAAPDTCGGFVYVP